MPLRLLQINLHHSKAASAALLLRLANSSEEIVLVQEPWVVKERVCGLNIDGFHNLYIKGKGTPRSCMLVNKKCSPLILPNFSDRDNVCVAIKVADQTVWLASSYMPHDADDPPPGSLKGAIREAASKCIPMIVGTDANAHHSIWGSTDINERGELLLEFILSQSLTICNRGNEPTFITSLRREVLDITLVNEQASELIRSWRVSPDDSMSDHRYIEFKVEMPEVTTDPVRNKRATNWEKYKSHFSALLEKTAPTTPTSREELDLQVEELTWIFNEAKQAACTRRRPRGIRKPRWWTGELAALKRECTKAFNLAKRTNDWQAHRAKLNAYKNVVRQTMTGSWCEFCSSVENATEGNRLRKVLAATPVAPAHICKSDGTWTMTAEDTLETLVDTHFPGQTQERQPEPRDSGNSTRIDPTIITKQKKSGP